MKLKEHPKIMLIYPPIVTLLDEWVPKNSQLPMGMAYVAAVLEKAGYPVRAIDAFTVEDTLSAGSANRHHGLSVQGIAGEIKNFRPHIVGISSMYTMYKEGTHIVAEIVKNLNKDILVICGGTHASANPEMLLQDGNIDAVVKGEGEITFLEIADAVENNSDIFGLDGVIYKKDGKIVENPPRAFVKNLDDLPYPARHLFPMQKYSENIAESKSYNIRHPATTIITSRGCPGRCIYCCVKRIWGNSWRARSPAAIVDEVEFLIKNYGIKEVHFTDDCISVDRKRLFKLCEEIIKRDIDIKWTTPAGIAIWQLDKDLLRIMKKSGCYRLTFGLESGDQETLNFIGKHYSYDYAREIIKEANRLGFWIAATFIIGFPNETKAQISRTISYAVNSELDFIIFYTPVIFPGTRLFDEFIKEGIAYRPEVTGTNMAYSTKHATEDELFKIRKEANSRYLFKRVIRPWRIIPKIRNKEDFTYFLKLASNILKNYIGSVCDKKTAFGMLRRSDFKKDSHNSDKN